DSSDEEIRQLMDELRAALDEYLQALQQQMAEQLARGEMPEMMPLPPDAQVVDRDQLQQMLDQMQQLAESGARDQAQQMLEQMQRMMENLQTGMMMPQPSQQSEAMQLLDDLQQLMRAQQQLLDQTFQQAQQGQ